jgi:hypothetical protein
MQKSLLSQADILAARCIEILDDTQKKNDLSAQIMCIVCDKITEHYQRAAITQLYETQTLLVEKINQMEEAANGNTDNTNKPDTGNDDTAGEYQPV